MRRVGVFVNEARPRIEADRPHRLRSTSRNCTATSCPPITRRRSRSGRPRASCEGFTFAPYENAPAEALLLDGPAAGLYGGSGRSFDWQLAARSGKRIIVAGGLDAGNVARAIELANPWGVDACSRIESAPGIKDHRKMIEFLLAAKAAVAA